MLSLKEGTPIARVVNSKIFKIKDGKSKYVGIVDDERESEALPGYTVDPYYLISEDELEEEVGSRKISKTRKSMKTKIREGIINQKVGKEFVLNDGNLEPVPNIDVERDVFYVSGPSGSGKSTFVANFLDNYCEIYPNNKIYMFSAVPTDPAFERFEDNGPKKTRGKMTRIILDADYLLDIQGGEGLTVDDLKDSAVIFDDVDVIPDKKIHEHVIDLRSRCLEIGRHYKITTCCTTHQLCNYKATKILLQEATKVVVFPKSGSTYHIKRFLKEYCGMNQKQIERVIQLPSRWVLVSKTYPQYILYRDGVYLT